MSPELRKEMSELLLHKRGIRLNLQLHVIESEDEVTLRDDTALAQRMVALWLVSHAARARDVSAAGAYVQTHQIAGWLSAQEHAFLMSDQREEREDKDEDKLAAPRIDDFTRFSSSVEALYFLAWCAGVVEKIVIPTKPSNLTSLGMAPTSSTTAPAPALQLPDCLRAVKLVRRKAQVIDWCDLLYRLHWAVRHAQLTGRAAPASLQVGAIQEWHRAANWLCQYEDERDWDKVSTETGA